MRSWVRYLPLIIVVLATIAALIINFYSNEEKVLFTAVESELSENEDGSFTIASIIENKDNVPVEVSGCYFDNPGCDRNACGDIGTLESGERVNIVIKCDSSVNRYELGRFTIQSRRVGEGESRTTTSGGSSFPNFSPGSLIPGGELNRGSGGSSGSGGGSGGGSGSGTNTNTPGGGPVTVIGNLETPGFDSISGDSRRSDFYIRDTTPTISFTTEGNLCRWSVNPASYLDMSSGNSCVVESTGGICNINQQTEGQHSYAVACALETTQNGVQVIRQNIAATNLRLSGTIDSVAPTFTSFAPNPGTTFPVSIINVVVNVNTNEITSCKARVGAEPTEFLYGNMNIDCGLNSLSHSCTIPLSEGINYISYVCLDRALNSLYLYFLYARFGERYISGPAIVSGNLGTFSSTPIPNIGTPSGQGNDDGGGGGGGGSSTDANNEPVVSTPEVPPDAGGGGGDGDGAGGDGVAPVGAVIRDFDSEHTLFEGIFNWFKNLFR